MQSYTIYMSSCTNFWSDPAGFRFRSGFRLGIIIKNAGPTVVAFRVFQSGINLEFRARKKIQAPPMLI